MDKEKSVLETTFSKPFAVRMKNASSPSGVAYFGPTNASGFKVEQLADALTFQTYAEAEVVADHWKGQYRGFHGGAEIAVVMASWGLIDAALDWTVAMCEGKSPGYEFTLNGAIVLVGLDQYDPSTNPAQGQPIIDRESIATWPDAEGGWEASGDQGRGEDHWGETQLIAALRCHVANKLGDAVEVPKELFC